MGGLVRNFNTLYWKYVQFSGCSCAISELRNEVLFDKVNYVSRFGLTRSIRPLSSGNHHEKSVQPDSEPNKDDLDRRSEKWRGREKNLAGPTFEDFIKQASSKVESVKSVNSKYERVPYIEHKKKSESKVYFETLGCQMNVNDTEIAWSILEENGFRKADSLPEADVVLVMTCAIREGAENKIWKRLQYYKQWKRKKGGKLKIGILGCMAERLKTKITEREKLVDVVCGPDAYRDLPRLLADTQPGQAAVNVLLSLDETYADVMPVRLNKDSKSAFVSIMRGCDNMCTYCIVPFTRGRERSRPVDSIIEEIHALSDQGIKEVMLLGQNVNSYRDISESTFAGLPASSQTTTVSSGFKTVYKHKKGGRRFADLLDKVSRVDPEMRIRFTSPHPKDFPDEVLHLIKERHNICQQIHLPAQSGNTEVLDNMRRGYTRQSYLELVEHIRSIIPDIALTSDFIAGFCGESEDAHQESLSLIHLVKYHFAYCFAYSMREKTKAHHRLTDDVPPDVKKRRADELITAFREESEKLNKAMIGSQQLILIEGVSKRSVSDMAGRTDGGTKVIFPNMDLPSIDSDVTRPIQTGDYIVAKVTGASSQVLHGIALHHTTMQEYHGTSSQHISSHVRIDVPTHSNLSI